MNVRELRKRLNAYFGNVRNEIIFVNRKESPAIYVEYEDFHSERHVEADIRRIAGDGWNIIVKRECSESLMRRVDRLLFGNRDDLRAYLSETLE